MKPIAEKKPEKVQFKPVAEKKLEKVHFKPEAGKKLEKVQYKPDSVAVTRTPVEVKLTPEDIDQIATLNA